MAYYTDATMTNMHLMIGQPYSSVVRHATWTKNILHISHFETETFFPPLIDSLEKMVHLTWSQMAMGDQEQC
jgi:hypothetical protein